MHLRQIGRSALQVPPLCFGGNVFGWTADEARSFELLDAFVAAGQTFIDTADIYPRWAPGCQGGESETILGRWLQRSGKRDQVILATKCGAEMGGDRKGLSRGWITQACEDSLRRLQTDRIDLYQAHRDDESTPQEETMAAFGALVKAGKVRVLGASNFSVERLQNANAIAAREHLPRFECLQPRYNLLDRADLEAALLPFCRRENIGIITYSSLASGFLTGKYRSEVDLGKSVRGKGLGKFLDPRGHRILQALDTVSARLNSTPTQVALAWLIAQPGITAPIVSATSRAQLADLLAAPKLRLDDAALQTLNNASAPTPVK